MRKKISLFLWKIILLLNKPKDIKPVGLPHQRDPNNPCEYYSPGKGSLWSFEDCEGDGHYLCRNCFHYAYKNEIDV